MKKGWKRLFTPGAAKSVSRVRSGYRKMLRLVLLTLVFCGLMACTSNTVAHVPGGGITYSFKIDWLKEVTFTQTIVDDPGRGNVFWANQFGFGPSIAGYTGYQTFKNGGGMFLFSVWGATAGIAGSPGTVCSPFDENGNGYGCHILQRPIAGHTYQFQLEPRSSGYYGVEVSDITAGTSFDLGQLKVGEGLMVSGNVELFTEYFDWNFVKTQCGDEAHSRMINQAPVSFKDGQPKTATYLHSSASSDCKGASKVTVNGNQAIQEYAIGNSPGGELIVQVSGLCADVMNGSSEVGAPLIQYPCSSNNGSNQVFVFASDGTLHTQNLCLDAGGTPLDGAPVVLAECSGSPTQQWKYTSYQSIESSGGLTLGVENLSTSSGARIIVKKIEFSNYPELTKWTFDTTPST